MRFRGKRFQVVDEIYPRPVAAVFETPFAAGGLDEDTAHGRGGGGEEMTATVPVLVGVFLHQPQVSLMNQGRRLKCLSGLFVTEMLRGQSPQFVVHQRQQSAGGEWVAL